MELYAAHVECLVSQRHDLSFSVTASFCLLSFVADSGHFETVGQPFVRYHPRMVASYGDVAAEMGKQWVVGNDMTWRCHAVEYVAEVFQPSSEGFADGLMAEAYAENGLAACIFADDVEQQSCFAGNARAGRQYDFIERFKLRKLELVVSHDGDVGAKFLDQMTQVVGERVVVVDDDYLHSLHFFGH